MVVASDPVYGVLLLSFSRHGHQRNFVPLFQRHPRTCIVGVADEPGIPPELAALNEKWARELAVPYYPSLDAGLARGDAQIVSIAHEQERNAGLAARCAAAGRHLWIDKYLGADLPECRHLVRAVREAGVKSIVPSYAYSQLLEQCRQVLATGELGSLLGVHVEVMFSKGWPEPPPKPSSQLLPPGRWTFPDLKRELLTVGAYAVGLIQECLAPPAWVQGRAGAYFFGEHAATATDDFGLLALGTAQGQIATLCGARVGVASHPLGGPLKAHLVGTAGTAAVDGKRPALDSFLRSEIVGAQYRPAAADPMQWASGSPTLGVPLAPDPTGLYAGLEDLVAALDADRQPRYTVDHALQLLEILIAGYRSAATGGAVVELPLTGGP